MKGILFLLFLLCSKFAFAQAPQMANGPISTFDSTSVSRDSSRVELTDFNCTESGNNTLKKFKYTLDKVQFYLPVYRSNLINSTLGNNGLPFQQLIYRPQFNQGFNWGYSTFNLYEYQAKDAVFYDAQSPFTRAFYVQGSKQEAFFQLEHAQNVGKSLNFGLSYQRINSAGFYTRQTAAATALRLHVWWRPEHSNYQLLFATSYNNQVAFENGGLTPTGDSIFRNNLETNRQLLPVWLQKSRNKIFNNSVQLRQTYDVLKPKADTNGVFNRNSTIRLQHTFNYLFRRNTFDDEDLSSGFYAQVADSNQFTSIYILQQWESEAAILKLSNVADTSSKISWEAKGFLKQQFAYAAAPFAFGIPQLVKNVSNQSAGGFIKLKLNKSILLNGAIEVFYAGYNAGDAKFESTIIIKPRKGINIEAGINSFTQNTNWQLSQYASNFASWNNDFKKISNLDVFGSLHVERFRTTIKVGGITTGNFVYLNALGVPQQASDALLIFYAKLENKINIGKFFLQSTGILQQTSGADVLRIPLFQIQESLYFRTFLNKKSEFRIGIDLMACSAFNANRYQAFSGLFYLQNETKNSGLIQTDFYISTKIRRVLFFAKLEHFNSGLNGYNYAITRFYPIPDRNLKLGFSWTFFD